MKNIKFYTAEQVDKRLENLVGQINKNNILLHTSIAENQKNVQSLLMILKSALSNAGSGEDGETVLAMAITLATLSQRVSLLEAKSGSKATFLKTTCKGAN